MKTEFEKMSRYLWIDAKPVLDLVELESEERARKGKMKKKYRSLNKEIDAVDKKIVNFQNRIEKADHDREKAQAEKLSLIQKKRNFVVAGDEKSATALEPDLFQCGQTIERAKETIDALSDALPLLEKEHRALADQRDEAFADMAAAWLQGEARAWDNLASELIQIGKRLAAANTILAGMNRQDVFRANTLRNQAFWSTRVPLMQNFNPRTMEPRTIFQHSSKVIDEVMSEILK